MNRVFAYIDRVFKRLRSIIYYRYIAILKVLKKPITNMFHSLYYYSRETTWTNTYWFGKKVLKNPFDLWIYQEILYRLKPNLIIECGTFDGGSAYYMASLCDLLKKGSVITIDIDTHPNRPIHPRITYLSGFSTDPNIFNTVKQKIQKDDVVLVVLDSGHSRENVLSELKLYRDIVTKGSYFIVDDSNINGHPIDPMYGPGPYEAVQDFLKSNPDFIIDRKNEKFFMTFNPNGLLKKV